MNSKLDELKKIHTKIHYNQTIENKTQKEIFETKKEATFHLLGLLNKNFRFLIKNFEGQRVVR